jgi:PKD repeat protein
LAGGINVKKLIVFALMLISIAGNSLASTRIFYEDCETTDYTTHFMEWNYGSGSQDFFDDMVAIMDQDTISNSGSYSMSYQPFLDRNPHTVIGLGSGAVADGNLSGFDISTVESRYWYFRWYQRWEDAGEDEGENKLLYINSAGYGDFTLIIHKVHADGFHIYAKDRATYSLIENVTINDVATSVFNPSFRLDETLEDEEWHKLEAYIDVGTQGNDNGEFIFTVDDNVELTVEDITYNSTISSTPIEFLQGWPSNVGGEDDYFDQRVWADDLEIYTLTGPTDIPGSEPTAAFSGTPLSGTAPLSVAFTDASTNTPTKWHWDFGEAATDTSALQNPTHEYDTAGIYTVTLAAYNADGNDSEVKTGYVTVTDGSGNTLADLSASVTTGTMSGSWTTDGAASWTVEAIPASGRSYSIWTESASFSFPVGATAYDVLVTSEDGPTATTSTGG